MFPTSLSLLQDPIQDVKSHLVITSLWTPLDDDSFLDFLWFWWPWQFWGINGMKFCRVSISFGLPDIFLMIRVSLWTLGGRACWWSVLLDISRVHTVNMTYHYWVNLLTSVSWWRSCLPGHFLLPPFLYFGLWKQVTKHNPSLKDGKLCSTSLRKRIFV